MRGFPLFNFLMVLGALGLSLIVLRVVTAVPEAAAVAVPVELAAAGEALATRVAVVLSGPAQRVELASLDGTVLLAGEPQGARMVGRVALPRETRALVLRVAWGAPGYHHFAKVSLEPEGLATLERVFDGRGDFDEVWEFPPFPAPTPLRK
jgi:hypothetical protein